jgi:hypothetical protein
VNKRAFAAVLAVVAIALLAVIAAWHHANQLLHASRAQFIATTIAPVTALVNENQAIIKQLHTDPFTENGAAILESYLAKIRRDGVPKHADMKQLLDQLAENDTAIVTLINAYSPQAKTLAFKLQANKFRNYAAAWRDRWNGVMELFMAGGKYPESDAAFPNDFPDAVRAELAAARDSIQ